MGDLRGVGLQQVGLRGLHVGHGGHHALPQAGGVHGDGDDEEEREEEEEEVSVAPEEVVDGVWGELPHLQGWSIVLEGCRGV